MIRPIGHTAEREAALAVFKDVKYAGFLASLFCRHKWFFKYGELGEGWWEYKCGKCGKRRFEDERFW